MAEKTNGYIDTRAAMESPLSFTQAIIKGLAPGGGLLVPERIPKLSLDEIISLSELPYHARAARIFSAFETNLSDDEIAKLMEIVYADNFDDERITPIVEVEPGKHVMELWHGPTSAFKDMALQCLPVFFSKAIEVERENGNCSEDFLILVATSGDTGKAALEGFKDRSHTKIMVFYPHGGVSDIQFKQMATQAGGNVFVLGGLGDFDDCQTSVKGTFNDVEFNERLAREHNVKLSSANSINWGRLLPQIVYYISAYSQLVADGALKAGELLDICVPTGNFGNILAAWYAKAIGTPVGKLICASNENRVLTDFIQSGIYDISERELILTPSPSMDILVSSNLERQLFELTGRDSSKVRQWMSDLSTKKRFEVDDETRSKMQENYLCGYATNAEALTTIREVYERDGYLLDPHTAVAWNVVEKAGPERPVLIASTAHWAKFGYDVYRTLNGIEAGAELPSEVLELTGVQLNELISEQTGGKSIPANLAMLDSLELRFTGTCEASIAGVEGAVATWLG